MKPRVVVSLVALGVSALAEPVRAQIPGCGGTQQSTKIIQVARQLYVIAYFNIVRDYNGCFLKVRSEGWIEGYGGAGSHEGAFSANFSLGQPVNEYSRQTAVGRYWLIELLWPWEWHHRGDIADWIDMIEPEEPPPPPQDDGRGCEVGGDNEGWDDSQQACTPIIVDTAYNGYRLTSVAEGVRFDLDHDGVPEQVSWTSAGSDDAFLALDRDGNGTIDNGSELFGGRTRAYYDTPEPFAQNGFEALKFTQNPAFGSSKPDDRIDIHDSVFHRLLLWRDQNHNGVSEADELIPAAHAGLVAISTNYRKSRVVDEYGNAFKLRAPSSWRVGRRLKTHPVFDVWLVTDHRAVETSGPQP